MPGLITVTLEAVTNLAEDRVVNTFPISGDVVAASPAQRQSLMEAVQAFYNAIPAGAVESPGQHIGDSISRTAGAHVTRLYNLAGALDGSPHGSPVAEDAFNLAPALGGLAYPPQVAYSIQLETASRATSPVEAPDDADPDIGVERPRQRQTGRIFLGHIQSSATQEISNRVVPTNAFKTACMQGILAINAALQAVGGQYQLCVWSRQGAFMSGVKHVSVTDVFDVQRRRRIKPSVRSRTTLP